MRSQLMNYLMGALLLVAVIELAWAWLAKRDSHTFKDTLSSIALGIGQQAINVYFSAGFLAVFAWIHAHLAPWSLDASVWWHWALLVVGIDFCYYVAHRAGHTINWVVAAHIVHHQAEDYNHLSAFRQSWTAWMVVFPFFVPLAVLGAPLEMFVLAQLGIMFLQFFSHNGVYQGKLGFLDKVIATPANHRVHHGHNAPYLGANCGGMLMLWDHVFGTYVEEDPENPIVMGVDVPVNFYDPFEANLDYYRRILFVMRHRTGLWNKLAIWVQSPEVLFAELDALRYDESRHEALSRVPLTARQKVVSLVTLVGLIGALFVHRVGYEGNDLVARLLTGAAVFGAIWFVGRLLSGRAEVAVATLDEAPLAAK